MLFVKNLLQVDPDMTLLTMQIVYLLYSSFLDNFPCILGGYMGLKRKSMVRHLVENWVNTVEQALIKYEHYFFSLRMQISIYVDFFFLVRSFNNFFQNFPMPSKNQSIIL